MEDYYKTLGVSKNASQEEIKRAYRKRAHEFHPDKPGGDEKKFKEINEAYQALSDPKQRSMYDQFGTTFAGAESGTRGFGGAGFDPFRTGAFSSFDFEEGLGDLFSEFFGAPRTRTKKARGQDVASVVEISLEEAFSGVGKTLHIETHVVCATCKGSGAKPDFGMRKCEACAGRGRVEEVSRSFFGSFARVKTCPNCEGQGEVPEKSCSTCRGKGRIAGIKDLEIQIPSGIEDGQILMLRGGGAAGFRVVESGDLAVTIHVRPHPIFRRSGTTLLSRKDIPFSVAVLGGTVSVGTIDGGSVRLKIPSGTSSGKVFRLRSFGMSAFGGRSRGEHLVTVRVDVPKKVSAQVRKTLENLKEEGL